MKLNIDVIEDTSTEYLDTLMEEITSNETLLAHDVAKEFTGSGGTGSGHITKHMSRDFNPFLFRSGADERYWNLSKDDGLTIIEILYSGMRLHEEFNHPLVWWQFATKETARNSNPRERTLARDYAYFQETGIDSVADESLAKHQGAVQKGLSEASEKDLKKAGEYLALIMQGKNQIHSPIDSLIGSRL